MQLSLEEKVDEIVEFLSYPTHYDIGYKEIKDIQGDIDKYSKLDYTDDLYGKLLIAQSLIHYRNGKYDDALRFADGAYTQGYREEVVYRLLDELSEPEYKNRYLIGINGWLFWFCLGFFVSIPIAVYNNFINYSGLGFIGVDALNEYQSWLGTIYKTIEIFENTFVLIHLALVVTALTLIIKRKRIAKKFTIIALVFGALYSIADYLIVNNFINMFDSSLSNAMKSEVNRYFSDNHLRTILSAFIWIPYFVLSGRVRATLNR